MSIHLGRRRCAWFIALALALAFSFSCKHQPSGGEIWARVDGHAIYRDQVEAIYRQRIAMLPGENKPEQALSFKLNILNELIDNQILLDEAQRMEISVPDQEVDARLAQLRSPDSGSDLHESPHQSAISTSALRQRIREDLTIQKLIEREIGARVSVTPQEIAGYYARNKANFTVPQTEYHLAQILVTPGAGDVHNLMNDDATNDRQARRKIRALAAQLRPGEDFAKVAEEYSEDPRTAQGGGDMGFIPASSLASDPVLERAVSKLKKGQITPVLHDKFGYRIVKLLGRVPAGVRSLSDPGVQKTIRETLMNQKEELLKAAYVEGLRDQAHVVNELAREIIQANGRADLLR